MAAVLRTGAARLPEPDTLRDNYQVQVLLQTLKEITLREIQYKNRWEWERNLDKVIKKTATFATFASTHTVVPQPGCNVAWFMYTVIDEAMSYTIKDNVRRQYFFMQKGIHEKPPLSPPPGSPAIGSNWLKCLMEYVTGPSVSRVKKMIQMLEVKLYTQGAETDELLEVVCGNEPLPAPQPVNGDLPPSYGESGPGVKTG